MENQEQLIAFVSFAEDPFTFLDIVPAGRGNDLVHSVFIELFSFEEFNLFDIQLKFVQVTIRPVSTGLGQCAQLVLHREWQSFEARYLIGVLLLLCLIHRVHI